MAIQMRRGNLANYDPDKMLSGEFGVVTDEDELYISFGPGNSKRVLTESDFLSGTITATDKGSGVVELSIELSIT